MTDDRGQQKCEILIRSTLLRTSIEIRNNLKIQMTQIQNKLNINERLGLPTLKTLPCWAICVYLLVNCGYYTKFQAKVN